MIEIRKPDATLAKLLPPVRLRADVNYIPSQFVLPFEQDGTRYVFHNLTKQCIEGELPASARAGEGCDELIAAQFLVPEDKDECAYYNQISALMRAYTRKKGVREYVIMPTLGCNARCVYCYEEGMKPVTMTEETAEQAIRYIIDTHAGSRVKLLWYGGEPLLGVKTIDRICEGMREAELPYTSSIISNGSLITPEIVAKMTNDWHLTDAQISMDGAEGDYISRKRYYTDHDYYHKVMNAVSLLSEAGITVNVRCNVDEENWERIPQFMADMKEGVRNKERVLVYFAPLFSLRTGENDLPIWEKVRDGRHLIEEAGFRSAFFLGLLLNLRSGHCMADGGGVVIGPDGSLYPCEHTPEESRFGDIWHGVTDEETRREFCRMDRTRDKCRTCPFLSDCTSFATCPVQDTHCREMRELLVIDALKRMVSQTETENTDGDTPAC